MQSCSHWLFTESQSQGSIERLHQILFGQIRALRLALCLKFKIDLQALPIEHAAVPWMVKHSAWLLNRFLVHDDGLTSFQRRFHQAALPGLVEFGEQVYFKAHGRRATAKADPSFAPGMWIGRDSDTGEHIIASETSVFKRRSIVDFHLHKSGTLTSSTSSSL